MSPRCVRHAVRVAEPGGPVGHDGKMRRNVLALLMLVAVALAATACGGGEVVFDPVEIDSTVAASTTLDASAVDPALTALEPCTLITREEAATALGAPVDEGSPSLADGRPGCTYRSSASVGESVRITARPAAYFDQIAANLDASPVFRYEPIEGLGDGALAQHARTPIGDNTDGDVLMVRSGELMLEFAILSTTKGHAEVIVSARPLAEAALGRL